MAKSKLKPAPAETPPSTRPASGSISTVKVATDVMSEIAVLENTIREEGWLPDTWVSKHGPTIRDRRDGMVLLHRGWQSVMLTTTGKAGDLYDLRTALVELAAAAIKVAADVDGYRAAPVPLAAELDCETCGFIAPSTSPGSRRISADDDDED